MKDLTINLDSLKKSELFIEDYFLLQLIHEEVDLNTFKWNDLNGELNGLEACGYIKILDDSIQLRQRGLDLFASLDSSKAIDEILLYLNEKAEKKFNIKTQANRKFVQGRLNEGYKKEDLKTVVDVMVDKWKNTNMEDYLRPETLFGAQKFQTYINIASKATLEDWSVKKV
jgi:uncharacterized phage protein (TIGR02220 family)